MLELTVISIVLLLTGIIPGRIIIEKLFPLLDLSGEEKIACSFGISFFLYYLVAFLGYVIKVDDLSFHLFILLVIAVIFIVFLINKKISITKKEKTLSGYFICAFVFIMSIQMQIPIYNGGGWMGDWYEHYERMQFYLKSLNLDFRFIGVYLLPARPPLFNLVTYFYNSVFGDSFWIFQAICTFMNLVVLFPIYLILRNVVKIKSKYIFLVLVSIFLLNPTFVRNLTYTWTRHLANYYVLLGVYFYLKGRKNLDFKYIYFGFALFAAGQLTHYSALVYLAVILVDFVIISLFRLRENIKPLISIILILAAILSTWYIWSINAYGPKGTFLSNTTYEAIEDKSFVENVKKDWLNFRNTVIPYFVYPELRPVAGFFVQKSRTGFLYDTMLGFYSASLIGNLTVSLSLVLLITLILKPFPLARRLKEEYRKHKFRDFLLTDAVFWVIFSVLSVLIGIHVNAPQICGCMHVTLQPLAILLVCVVIKRMKLIKSQMLKVILLSGIMLEAVAVIGSSILLKMPVDFNDRIYAGVFYANWSLKIANNLVFLYDKFNNLQPLFIVLTLAGTILLLSGVTYYLFEEKN